MRPLVSPTFAHAQKYVEEEEEETPEPVHGHYAPKSAHAWTKKKSFLSATLDAVFSPAVAAGDFIFPLEMATGNGLNFAGSGS